MSQIILDIGSGNTLTDYGVGQKLIDEIAKRDTRKHEVIFKAQLFTNIPPNKPLMPHVFAALREYAWTVKYKMTSSVFDKFSLECLLATDTPHNPLPFVKIACRPELYWLIGEVPRKIPVYMSFEVGKRVDLPTPYNVEFMYCVPQYPAPMNKYNVEWTEISDHTVGLDLYRMSKPRIWEKHIVLERDPKNPDSGPFAIVPSDLDNVL